MTGPKVTEPPAAPYDPEAAPQRAYHVPNQAALPAAQTQPQDLSKVLATQVPVPLRTLIGLLPADWLSRQVQLS